MIVTRKLFRLLLVLWAGSLWSLTWVTATVFRVQSDRHLAGALAGSLFSIETYVGLAVGIAALLLPGRAAFRWGYAAVVLLAINEWALRPVMNAARLRGAAGGLTFGAWHGVSALLYGLACVALIALLWKDDGR